MKAVAAVEMVEALKAAYGLVLPPTLLIFIRSEPWQLALPRRLRCLLERRGESPGCLPPRLRRPGHLEFGFLLSVIGKTIVA